MQVLGVRGPRSGVVQVCAVELCSLTLLRMFPLKPCPSRCHSRMVLSEEQERKEPEGRRTSRPSPPPSGYACRTKQEGNVIILSLVPDVLH